MALPKHRHSRTRQAKRRTNQKLVVPPVVECPHCKAPMQSHHVCKSCGYYAGRSAITVTEK